MTPANEAPWPSDHVLLKTPRKTLTIIAIIHFASWATCLVLGITAVWLRLQSTQGWERTFFGMAGVAVWASLPFFFCGVFTIAVFNTNSRYLVTWFMLTSGIGWFCSLAILTYSVIAVVNESSVEVYPRRLIVASVTLLASFVEFLTTLKSGLVAYQAIGCHFNFQCTKSLRRSKNKIRPDVEKGYVTVMTLPAREAAELFYTMFRSRNNTRTFASSEGFIGGGEYPSQFFDHYIHDNRRPSPDDRRKHKRKHHNRRNFSRNESPDGDNSAATVEREDSDNEFSATNVTHHANHSGDLSSAGGRGTTDEVQNSSKSNRLATLHERKDEASRHQSSLPHRQQPTS